VTELSSNTPVLVVSLELTIVHLSRRLAETVGMGRSVKVAVIGAGWWSQGWHLVHLKNHPDVELVAIVDSNQHPKSNLNPNLESLKTLSERYKCQIYSSLVDLLENCPEIDGVLIASPHATHFELGQYALDASMKRLQSSRSSGCGTFKPIHILMEKPMTVCLQQAMQLAASVNQYRQAGGRGAFIINHSANYRDQAVVAARMVQSGRIGVVRHVTAFMASPLSWIFEDEKNIGWNQPDNTMLGNGFAWGQSSHLLAWIYHVCPDLQPATVFCSMTHSERTGADVAHAATVTCRCGAVLSISGTSLLPGNAHSDPPVGKRLRLEIYGTAGALFYNGKDTDPNSGHLEVVDTEKGQSEILHGNFDFEDLASTGTGPASLQSWIDACQGQEDYYQGADCELGLKTVQTISAMYQSHATQQLVSIPCDDSVQSHPTVQF
jgi:predicted dehydrogenase